jgi:uncharacterized membrane protein YadS
MTRNLFMAPVIVLMGVLYSRRGEGAGRAGRIDWKKTFPLFVLGFIGMALLHTFGVMPADWVDVLKSTASFLIVVAIAAVGMSTSFASMKQMGLRPFFLGLAASTIMGVISYTLIQVLTSA